MGIREYARHREANGLIGKTLRAVQKAIASGRIELAPDGRIDSAAADAAWAARTDMALQRGAQAAVATEPEVLPLLDGVVEKSPVSLSPGIDWRAGGWDGPMPPPPPREERQVAANVVDLGLYQRSKAEREFAEAEMAKDELAKRRGKLLDAGDAQKTFAAMGRMYAQGREGVPAQLAPQLVGLTDIAEIERRLRAMLRETDERISQEIRSRYAEVVDGRIVAAG